MNNIYWYIFFCWKLKSVVYLCQINCTRHILHDIIVDGVNCMKCCQSIKLGDVFCVDQTSLILYYIYLPLGQLRFYVISLSIFTPPVCLPSRPASAPPSLNSCPPSFMCIHPQSPSPLKRTEFPRTETRLSHLCDSPRKRLSRAIPVLSGTNSYNTGIKEELHNIITTSEYNSSAQAGYKSDMTESRKVKHLRSGSIEAKRLQLHRQTRA
jgi:hypothetical protein